jgi:hypothetical protein
MNDFEIIDQIPTVVFDCFTIAYINFIEIRGTLDDDDDMRILGDWRILRMRFINMVSGELL